MEHGFRASLAEGADRRDTGHVAPGGAVGEAETTVRCWGSVATGGRPGGRLHRGAPVGDSNCRTGG